ncbi:MAG: M20/M25/M40 family metallo-hydrolase [Gammaproteobacteria bacterium]|nr:M20/M25/M40 family metallo-hydrolase [Gammaproteobacteria bacterium]MBV8405855.1 M20/M25/M40 family metallo-hydrolase [Gammaproteobacteria bacterium]
MAATAVRAAPATAPETVAVQLRDAAMAGHDIAYSWVSELTTRFGPRPAGSPNEQQAAAWAADKLKALGFENVRVETFPITAWVRGTESGQLVAPATQPLAVAALGESPPTPPGGLEGDVVIFPTLADLQAAPPGSLAGRIAMIAQRTVRAQNGAGYSAAVPARTDGPGVAAQRGAIGFLLRSVGTDSHRLAHTGTTRYVEGRVPLPAFALSAPDADQVERIAALGQTVRVRLFSGASYVRDAHSQNVIAEVRGRERPQEVVLLGAHLDSWDQGTGAIDDGAGTAIIAAAAKLIRDLPHRPRRTVRVVLFGSEEIAQPVPPGGAFGGHAYADGHRAELAGHVLAGESDLGSDRVYSLALPAAVGHGEFATTLLRVLTPIGVLGAERPPEDAGTDIGPSVEAGVPAFELSQDAMRYFDIHHTADDTLDKIDRAQLDQNVAAWAALVWLAADSEVDFRH